MEGTTALEMTGFFLEAVLVFPARYRLLLWVSIAGRLPIGASPGSHLPPRQRSRAAPTDVDRHTIFLQQKRQKQMPSRVYAGSVSASQWASPLKCRHFVVGTRFCASAARPTAGNAVLEQRPLPILPTAFQCDPVKKSIPERWASPRLVIVSSLGLTER
jgi:hypothetical protein